MKVNIKQPLNIDGAHYAPGIQDVPDALAQHWYFQAQKLNGVIIELKSDEPTPQAKEPTVVAPPTPVVPPQASDITPPHVSEPDSQSVASAAQSTVNARRKAAQATSNKE